MSDLTAVIDRIQSGAATQADYETAAAAIAVILNASPDYATYQAVMNLNSDKLRMARIALNRADGWK